MLTSQHFSFARQINARTIPSTRRLAAKTSGPNRITGIPGHAHLVGIAGAGMQALADWLLGSGWTLSGSDMRVGDVAYLRQSPAILFDQHAAGQLPHDTCLIVYSAAISTDNPELVEGRRRALPMLTYPQAVGQIMARGLGLAVAGTHGKSTTTAMLAHILVAAGADPSVLCGARQLLSGTSGRYGRGPVVLAEACEYQKHFLALQPAAVSVLGIEADHFDCYRDLPDVERSFAEFLRSVPSAGLLMANQDCEATRHVVSRLGRRTQWFSTTASAPWCATAIQASRGYYCFDIARNGRPWASVELQVPGRHNVQNALAAAALAGELNIDAPIVRGALNSFSGLRRRMETVGQFGGITVIDDYAHHPTAVAAAIATARQLHPSSRLWCVFEPHQASRTRRLLDELADSLQNADKLVVAEVYRAREAHEGPCQLSHQLAQRVARRGTSVVALPREENLLGYLVDSVAPGDVLLTLGAGNTRKICDEFVQRL